MTPEQFTMLLEMLNVTNTLLGLSLIIQFVVAIMIAMVTIK